MTKKWSYLTIVAAMTAAIFAFSCGSDTKDDKDTSSGTTYTWAADIAPIVVSDCSDSGCHGTSSPASIVYQDNETNFKAAKTQVIARLSLSPTTAGYMPQGQQSFATEKKQKLIDFLNQ